MTSDVGELSDYTHEHDTWFMVAGSCPECGHTLAGNGTVVSCPGCEWWEFDD